MSRGIGRRIAGAGRRKEDGPRRAPRRQRRVRWRVPGRSRAVFATGSASRRASPAVSRASAYRRRALSSRARWRRGSQARVAGSPVTSAGSARGADSSGTCGARPRRWNGAAFGRPSQVPPRRGPDRPGLRGTAARAGRLAPGPEGGRRGALPPARRHLQPGFLRLEPGDRRFVPAGRHRGSGSVVGHRRGPSCTSPGLPRSGAEVAGTGCSRPPGIRLSRPPGRAGRVVRGRSGRCRGGRRRAAGSGSLPRRRRCR